MFTESVNVGAFFLIAQESVLEVDRIIQVTGVVGDGEVGNPFFWSAVTDEQSPNWARINS